MKVSRRLRLLKVISKNQLDVLKRTLGTDKQISDYQALRIRIEAAEDRIKQKQINQLNKLYQENLNRIIDETTTTSNAGQLGIDFQQIDKGIENRQIPFRH